LQTFFRIKSWLRHSLLEIDEYSIHSPFLYEFYNRCFKNIRISGRSETIESIRRDALHDKSRITTGIIGASSEYKKIQREPVGKIAGKGITSLKYSLLFQNLIRHFDCQAILELGTSLGINTLYLAGSGPGVKVHTMEGNPALCSYASKVFSRASPGNITLVEGNIDETLTGYVVNANHPDFVYFDANHKYKPTLHYFSVLNTTRTSHAVFVLDDIYWSEEMAEAWEVIRHHPDVRVDIDLFQAGLLLFQPDLPRLSVRLAF